MEVLMNCQCIVCDKHFTTDIANDPTFCSTECATEWDNHTEHATGLIFYQDLIDLGCSEYELETKIGEGWTIREIYDEMISFIGCESNDSEAINEYLLK